MDMSNKVAVITGGSTGIGFATAALLAKRGADVVLAARNEAALARARDEIGERASMVTTDVTRPEDVERLFRFVRERYEGIDALFVNAGIAEFAMIEEADLAHFDRLFNTNVRGAFLTTKYAEPLLRKGASVLYNSSVAGLLGVPSGSVYGATKGALAAFARNMAAEWIGRSVRVNTLSPGPTLTEIQAKANLTEEANARIGRYVQARLHIGRMAEAGEVAAVAAFLLSPEASFIVGQDLAVDGGMTGV